MTPTENYTKVPNGFLEKLALLPVNGQQFRVIMIIARETLGFQGRKKARITLELFAKKTGITPASNISRLLLDLIAKGIVEVSKNKNSGNQYNIKSDILSINPDTIKDDTIENDTIENDTIKDDTADTIENDTTDTIKDDSMTCPKPLVSMRVCRTPKETFKETFKERKEKEKEKEKEKGGNPPKTPPVDSIKIPDNLNNEKFLQAWEEFKKHRIEKKARLTPTASVKLLKMLSEMGSDQAIIKIDHAIANGWKGVIFPNDNKAKAAGKAPQSKPDGKNQWAGYGKGGEN